MRKRLISIFTAAIMLISLLAIPVSADETLGAYTTTSLNLRKSASTSSSVLMTMPKGAEVIVLSTSNGWSKVIYNDTIGYASKSYLKSDSSVSGKFGTGTITGSDVRMRKGAGTSYSIVGTYSKGTKMTVTGAKGSWYAVKYNGKTGYVRYDYMSISAPSKTTSSSSSSSSSTSTTYTGVITGNDVRMRKGAGTSYSVVGTYDKGTKMTITGSQKGWYKVSYNGKTGYISADYMRLSPKTAYSSSKTGTVSSSGQSLRMGPSSSFTSVMTVSKGSKVTISGIYGSYYEVTINGKYGYIYKGYVSLSSSGSSSSIPAPSEKLDKSGTVSGTSVRLRSGPGTSYSTIGYYDNGTKVEITGKTGSWYAVTVNGTKGYMHSDYIKLKTTDSTGSTLGNQIVATAKQYLGTPYVYGGASPKGFDCSGLVYYVYGQYGYKLQRGAGSQYRTDGTPVSKSDLQPGDLVFFSERNDYSSIGHVGMYVGNGQFIHASSGKGQVIISDLDGYYYAEHYFGAKRII